MSLPLTAHLSTAASHHENFIQIGKRHRNIPNIIILWSRRNQLNIIFNKIHELIFGQNEKLKLCSMHI